MSWGGSCQERAHIAFSLASNAGATPLGALIVGEVASYHGPCFKKDRQLAEQIVQRNGRHPHPRSVARARRNVARMGLLDSERVMPGHKPKGARFSIAAGTTNKIVRFDRMGSRDPINRGERHRGRLRELAIEAVHQKTAREPVSQEVRQPSDRPRHSAPVPIPDPEFARMLEEATTIQRAKWERIEQREDARMMESVLHASTAKSKPPD